MAQDQKLETNKKIARQSFEAFQKNDMGLLESITDTKNFSLHFPGYPETMNYQDSVKLNQEYNSAFPDVKVTIENQVAEGDYVVTQATYQGTHKGELQGVRATNKKVKVTGMSLQKIENGKITEQWDEFDALGMMQQIGAVAVPEHAHTNNH